MKKSIGMIGVLAFMVSTLTTFTANAQVNEDIKFDAIDAGDEYVLAIENGNLWAWGRTIIVD